jgi:hypothetical protein
MQQNLDIKVSSLFKEKKQNNRKIKIIFDSDSDNDQIRNVDKQCREYDNTKENKSDFQENENIFKNENIKLDENKEIIKSCSQSSNSTSASQSNNSSNSKNIPARSANFKKPNIYFKNKENKDKIYSEENEETFDIFNISSGTKKILEKIKEKHKRAKIENKIINNEICIHSPNTNNKETKKFIGKKTKNGDFISNKEAKIKNKLESIKLSERTKEAIKKLKKVRASKCDNNTHDKENIIEKVMNRRNSFSNLHIKYDELLLQSRELRLPIIYKKIFESFISLDKTINRNKKTNNNLNTFNNIRKILESYTYKNFNINIFKQILYIVPHFYILKYVSNNKMQSTFSVNEVLDKNYDLLIDIPSDFDERIKTNYPSDFNFLEITYYSETDNKFDPITRSLSEKEMNQRKQIFHNILNYIVSDYHDKFLKENKIKIKFNPLTQKTWHHEFDPDKYCKPIPFFEFPSPPEYKSIFAETINKNDIKSQLSSIKYDDSSKKEKESNSSSASKFVSEEYIKKIRAKEQALNIVKEINQFNYYYNHKSDGNRIIKNMLLQVKTLLMTHKKSMELNVLSELILNSNRIFKDYFENVQKLNNVIINICKKYSDFININNHSRLGYVVVLQNSEYQIPDNYNDID